MTKFEPFNSSELSIIKEVFDELHYLQLDVNLAYIVESYIYKWVEKIDKTGNIKCRYRIKYGEKDGEYIAYYPNGKIHIQKSFINGKLNGEYKEWWYPYSKPQLNEQKYYLDGQLNGVWESWTASGQLYSERTFIKDKLQEYKRWNEKGIIVDHQIYKIIK